MGQDILWVRPQALDAYPLYSVGFNTWLLRQTTEVFGKLPMHCR
jgi:hypothetical protein